MERLKVFAAWAWAGVVLGFLLASFTWAMAPSKAPGSLALTGLGIVAVVAVSAWAIDTIIARVVAEDHRRERERAEAGKGEATR